MIGGDDPFIAREVLARIDRRALVVHRYILAGRIAAWLLIALVVAGLVAASLWAAGVIG